MKENHLVHLLFPKIYFPILNKVLGCENIWQNGKRMNFILNHVNVVDLL